MSYPKPDDIISCPACDGDKKQRIGIYNDPNHRYNGPEYHTGDECITAGCSNPAGTAWGPHWCFECNVKRIEKISDSLEALQAVEE